MLVSSLLDYTDTDWNHRDLLDGGRWNGMEEEILLISLIYSIDLLVVVTRKRKGGVSQKKNVVKLAIVTV